MSYRKLELNGREWRFKVGRTYCDIRDPDGKGHRPTVGEVKGMSTERVKAGRRADEESGRIFDGMIGPGDIRRWIEQNGAVPFPRSLLDRMTELTAGIEVDLDESIDGPVVL